MTDADLIMAACRPTLRALTLHVIEVCEREGINPDWDRLAPQIARAVVDAHLVQRQVLQSLEPAGSA